MVHNQISGQIGSEQLVSWLPKSFPTCINMLWNAHYLNDFNLHNIQNGWRHPFDLHSIYILKIHYLCRCSEYCLQKVRQRFTKFTKVPAESPSSPSRTWATAQRNITTTFSSNHIISLSSILEFLPKCIWGIFTRWATAVRGDIGSHLFKGNEE